MTKMTKTKKTATPKIPADLAEILVAALCEVEQDDEYAAGMVLKDSSEKIEKYLKDMPAKKINLELNAVEVAKIRNALGDDPCIGEALAKKILDALK